MKRFLRVGNAVVIMFFCCILCCTACGEVIRDEEMTESASETSTTSTISVKKDGSISISFTKNLYFFTAFYYKQIHLYFQVFPDF